MGGERAWARHAVHMGAILAILAILAGYRKALVSTGWAISHLVSTNGHRKMQPLL